MSGGVQFRQRAMESIVRYRIDFEPLKMYSDECVSSAFSRIGQTSNIDVKREVWHSIRSKLQKELLNEELLPLFRRVLEPYTDFSVLVLGRLLRTRAKSLDSITPIVPSKLQQVYEIYLEMSVALQFELEAKAQALEASASTKIKCLVMQEIGEGAIKTSCRYVPRLIRERTIEEGSVYQQAILDKLATFSNVETIPLVEKFN